MQRPSFIPIPTVFSILLFIAIVTTAVFTSLLLLFHYCYFHKTVTTDKLLRARLLSGAAELTTHMLRLIIILWLPLCRINKLGFTTLEDCGDPLYLWVISSCFCAENQLSRKIPENMPKVLFSQKTHGARRRGAEGPGVGQTTPWRGPGLAAPGWHLAASGTFSATPFAYMTYVT